MNEHGFQELLWLLTLAHIALVLRFFVESEELVFTSLINRVMWSILVLVLPIIGALIANKYFKIGWHGDSSGGPGSGGGAI